MSTLASWLFQCRNLPQPDRSLLWLGMGIWRADAPKALGAAGFPPDPVAALEASLRRVLKDAAPDKALSWSPPDEGQEQVNAFAVLTPAAWVEIVKRAFGTQMRDRQLRIRAARLRATTTEDFALLHESELTVAVSVYLPTSSDLFLERPLRIASTLRPMPDHDGTGPADLFQLAAERANSDLLVNLGPLRALLADVVARPYSCKTNMIVIRQALPSAVNLIAFVHDLRYLVKLVRANAVLVVAPDTSDVEVSDALEFFASDSGFDEPFDMLLRRVFGSKATLLCSSAFANLRHSGISSGQNRGAAGRNRIPSTSQTRRVPSFGEGWPSFNRARSVERTPTAAAPFNPTRAAPAARPTRFMQQQSFRLENEPVPATGGFRARTQCAVDVRVGPMNQQWDSLMNPFPDHLLPATGTSTLTVWLTEPRHLPQGAQGRITLAPDGPSGTCRLTFVAGEAGDFDGRVTVLHHGRVLQTARLIAKVLGARDDGDDEGTPRLREHVWVSRAFEGLDARKNFDIAIVTNHGMHDMQRVATYSAEQAQVTALDAAAAIGKEINDVLSTAASTAVDMVGGIESEGGRELIVKLARKGRILGVHLFQNGFERRAQVGIARENRIQIIHTRSDGVMPLEFVYDHPSPATDAALCPNWKAAIAAGDCPGTCALATSDDSAKHVCPMGFWGISKVIERHQFDAKKTPPGVVTLLAEHTPGAAKIDLSGEIVLAFSKRVLEVPRRQVQAMLKNLAVKSRMLTSWTDWESVVGETNPALIVSMPHADGTGSEITLEIEGIALEIADLKRGHLTAKGDKAVAPVVMLIGCDIAQTFAEYGSYIEMFRSCGAAVVVATVSTVYGSQAAAAASRLAQTIFSDPDGATTIGEALRDTRRQALLNGEVMPLALVAYGDADWELTTGG